MLTDRVRFSERNWVLTSDNDVIIGSRSAVIRRISGGEHLVELLNDIRTALSFRTMPLNDLCDSLTDKFPKLLLTDAVKQLIELGVLEYEQSPTGSDRAQELSKKLGAFFANQKTDSTASSNQLESSSVGIVGSTEFSNIVIDAVEGVGVQSIIPKHEENLSQNEEERNTQSLEDQRELLSKSDFLIGCAVDPIDRLVQFPKINQLCLELNKPWISLVLDGDVIQLGPLFIPNETGCYRCLELREESRLPHRSEFLQFKNRIGEAWKTVLDDAPPSAKFIAAHLVATEVLRIAAKTSFPSTYQTMITLNTQTFQTEQHTLLRVPFCDVCGIQNHQPFRKLWNI